MLTNLVEQLVEQYPSIPRQRIEGVVERGKNHYYVPTVFPLDKDKALLEHCYFILDMEVYKK